MTLSVAKVAVIASFKLEGLEINVGGSVPAAEPAPPDSEWSAPTTGATPSMPLGLKTSDLAKGLPHLSPSSTRSLLVLVIVLWGVCSPQLLSVGLVLIIWCDWF